MSNVQRTASDSTTSAYSQSGGSTNDTPRQTVQQRRAASLASRRIEGKVTDLDSAGYKQLPKDSKLRKALLNSQEKDQVEDAGKLQDEQGYHQFFNVLVKEAPQTGLKPIINAVLQAEIESGSNFGKDLLNDKFQKIYIEEAFVTLSILPHGVLQELCLGNIDRCIDKGQDKNANPSLKRLRAEIGQLHHHIQKNEHPTIYTRHLISDAEDENGEAYHHMQAYRVLEVCNQIEQYLAPAVYQMDWEKFYKIDTFFENEKGQLDESSWAEEYSKEGFRRWLSKKTNAGYKPVPSRYNQGSTFVTAVRNRVLDQMENHPDPSLPIYVPLQYVGYALDNESRKMQHDSHNDQTNWLSNVFLAIAKMNWPDEKYCFSHYPICPLAREKQAAIAELLLTRLTNSYYHNGGGFNIAIAGQTASIQQVNGSKWLNLQEWLLSKWDFARRIQEQTKLQIPWQQKQDKEAKEHLITQLQHKQAGMVDMKNRTKSLLDRVEQVKDSEYFKTQHPGAYELLQAVDEEVGKLRSQK